MLQCDLPFRDPLGGDPRGWWGEVVGILLPQTLFESIEQLSVRLAIYHKIKLTSHAIFLFLLKDPHFYETPDICLKLNW